MARQLHRAGAMRNLAIAVILATVIALAIWQVLNRPPESDVGQRHTRRGDLAEMARTDAPALEALPPNRAANPDEGAGREEHVGFVPVGEVEQVPPPRVEPRPVRAPPPDPATHRPPLHNPGGVNGDRPPRFEPGPN